VDGFGWSEAVRVPAETVRPTVEAACDDAVLVSVTIQAAAATPPPTRTALNSATTPPLRLLSLPMCRTLSSR
jgi:hypothetical protein